MIRARGLLLLNLAALPAMAATTVDVSVVFNTGTNKYEYTYTIDNTLGTQPIGYFVFDYAGGPGRHRPVTHVEPEGWCGGTGFFDIVYEVGWACNVPQVTIGATKTLVLISQDAPFPVNLWVGLDGAHRAVLSTRISAPGYSRIPEPSSVLLISMGLIATWGLRRPALRACIRDSSRR